MTGKTGPDPRTTDTARMHRVQAHVDRHQDQPLDLATLADVVRRRRLPVGATR